MNAAHIGPACTCTAFAGQVHIGTDLTVSAVFAACLPACTTLSACTFSIWQVTYWCAQIGKPPREFRVHQLLGFKGYCVLAGMAAWLHWAHGCSASLNP